MNLTARLDSEIIYFDLEVQCVSPFATGTLLCYFKKTDINSTDFIHSPNYSSSNYGLNSTSKRMTLALNNRQRLISHQTKTPNKSQPTLFQRTECETKSISKRNSAGSNLESSFFYFGLENIWVPAFHKVAGFRLVGWLIVVAWLFACLFDGSLVVTWLVVGLWVGWFLVIGSCFVGCLLVDYLVGCWFVRLLMVIDWLDSCSCLVGWLLAISRLVGG